MGKRNQQETQIKYWRAQAQARLLHESKYVISKFHRLFSGQKKTIITGDVQKHYSIFFPFFTEKLYKEPAVYVPSLQHLSKIAYDLGLDVEERELMKYQGEFLVSVKH